MARAAAVGFTDNLAELENLNENTLLAELKSRFNRKVIYSYVGEILVSINPFEIFQALYAPDQMSKYRQVGNKADHPPHVFALADIAYHAMHQTGKNQVCVISGESGAGKTEAAKLFVKQLVNVSNGAEFEGLENKLIEVNPVLEAFGNAKTKYNDNSSRFGKYTSVNFNSSGQVKGAVMQEYLLEKSRVISQSDNEQNFHVFYLLFQGLGGNAQYALGDIEDHRYTESNPEAVRAARNKTQKFFAVEWAELDTCFKTIGFEQEQVEDLFHTMSGIIHIGNLEFDGEDVARICSDQETLETICDQLSIAADSVELAFTRQMLNISGEEVERKLKQEQADDVRDATAKAIYTKTFSWIVKECNRMLQHCDMRAAPDDTAMGILDIFGFENFDVNSLEQLCINLTNEQLQWYFNEFIFAMELAEYKAEGITGKGITYEKNEPLLELLLSNRPLGLLAILDEESNFPKATDSTMIIKFHQAYTKHKDYTAPRGNENYFTLKHYAGAVQYNGLEWLEKNRDTLAPDVVGALRISENDLVKELFGGDEGGGGGGKKGGKKGKGRLGRGGGGAATRMSIKHARTSMAKKKQKTISATFKTQLMDLKRALLASAPHFIRTIKSNHQKRANIFDEGLVKKQLSYTGMLETTRIRREGYSSRPLFTDFVHRYKVLGFPCRADVRPTAEACRQILNKSGIEGFEVGRTKVFMRYWHADELNSKLEPYTTAATLMSKYCRGFTARSKYGALVQAKREQDRMVQNFLDKMERSGQGTFDVIESLDEEDAREHPRQWGPPPEPVKKSVKKGKGKGGAGLGRAASVKWFKETQEEQVKDDGGFADWFHGIITRVDAEKLLRAQSSGAFLIRVAESRFGYSLSLNFQGRCKHFMIDQNDEDRYLVVGNDRTFPSLNEVVAFHMKHPVTDDGDTLITACPTEGFTDALAELE